MCRVGGGEGNAWGASDSVEDLGFASVVERFCVCVEKDSHFGTCYRERLKNFPKDFPPGSRREKPLCQE